MTLNDAENDDETEKLLVAPNGNKLNNDFEKYLSTKRKVDDQTVWVSKITSND
jgi:hypothetical protein